MRTRLQELVGYDMAKVIQELDTNTIRAFAGFATDDYRDTRVTLTILAPEAKATLVRYEFAESNGRETKFNPHMMMQLFECCAQVLEAVASDEAINGFVHETT